MQTTEQSKQPPVNGKKGQLPKLILCLAIHPKKIMYRTFQLNNYWWKHTQPNDSATLIPFICYPESSFHLIVDGCRTRFNSSANRQPLTCCVVLGELGDALDWRTQREMTSENRHKCLSVKNQSATCKSDHFHEIFLQIFRHPDHEFACKWVHNCIFTCTTSFFTRLKLVGLLPLGLIKMSRQMAADRYVCSQRSIRWRGRPFFKNEPLVLRSRCFCTFQTLKKSLGLFTLQVIFSFDALEFAGRKESGGAGSCESSDAT